MGQQAYDLFCENHSIQPAWPVTLQSLSKFIAYLSIKGYSAATARSYIASISYKCKAADMPDVTKSFTVSKLLEGFRRSHSTTDGRLPITVDILKEIIKLLPIICSTSYEATLFSVASSLAFYAFLRIGEFTLSNGNSRDTIISRSDVQLSQNTIKLLIRSSKTDQYKQGTCIEMFSVSDQTCPVHWTREFLEIRPVIPGPFFCHRDGTPLKPSLHDML